VPMLVLAAMDRSVEGRWNVGWWLALRPWVGVPIIAAIAGPWLWAVHRAAPEFLPRIFKAASRHAAGDAKHLGPPGYYLAFIWGLFFPWSLLLPLTIVTAW